MGYTVRTDTHRYTEWQDRQSGEVKAQELYDHTRSHLEASNVVSEEANLKTVASIQDLLAAGWEKLAADG